MGELVGLVVRWLIIAVAVAAAAWIVPGIHVDDESGVTTILIVGAVLAVVNLIVKPVLTALSCCLIVLTLGLFLLVINTATFWLAARISDEWLDVGFRVDGFWPAFFGGLVVSVVSWLLTAFVDEG